MKTLVDIILTISLFLLVYASSIAQSNVGINTPTPERSLEAEGAGDQYVRIHSTLNAGGETALELILGGPGSPLKDFKIANDEGFFKIFQGADNFQSAGVEVLRINTAMQVGIGTTDPTSRLHINNGEDASLTDDGYLMLGNNASSNLIMDNNEIMTRNNGNNSTLMLQSHNGNTTIGNGTGDVYFGVPGGNVGIGTSTLPAPLTIDDADFQISLRNTGNGIQQWNIGATTTSWTVGDDQLIFSPDQTSGSSVLRLKDVNDNNGTDAPLMIHSGASQVLLIDGNEIDSREGPLYINHNSNEETYINPSGGRVGMGYDFPSSTLHVRAQDDEDVLRIQNGSVVWEVNPEPSVDWLGFVKDGWTVGHIDGASGQWETISDRRLKKDIIPIENVLDKVNQLIPSTYAFKHDSTSRRQIGLIAQDVENYFPDLVKVDEHGGYTLAYSKISVLLIKAIQEQQKEIDALYHELSQLVSSQKP